MERKWQVNDEDNSQPKFKIQHAHPLLKDSRATEQPPTGEFLGECNIFRCLFTQANCKQNPQLLWMMYCFSKHRRRTFKPISDPGEIMRRGLELGKRHFDAQPVADSCPGFPRQLWGQLCNEPSSTLLLDTMMPKVCGWCPVQDLEYIITV